ncbi:MAG: hypothetical protein IPO82_13945 [Betaproteobacteria bacterium]|nr:hypothetical protein [Betaproteobacteria bacterium]
MRRTIDFGYRLACAGALANIVARWLVAPGFPGHVRPIMSLRRGRRSSRPQLNFCLTSPGDCGSASSLQGFVHGFLQISISAVNTGTIAPFPIRKPESACLVLGMAGLAFANPALRLVSQRCACPQPNHRTR